MVLPIFGSSSELTVSSKPLTSFQPLTSFSLFSQLPAEIRFYIWRIVCREERIIELEAGWWPREGDLPSGSTHYYYQIPSNSCRVPTILHVSQEARREALAVYQLIDLTDDIHAYPRKIPVYYNPDIDIIFFGEGCCMLTVFNFVSSMYHRKQEIRRVAILCSGMVLGSCQGGHQEPGRFEGFFDPHGMYTPMQILHGIDQGLIEGVDAPGCVGLKEVFWVVPTKLKYLMSGQVDENICFRPATGTGMTTGQMKWRKRLEEVIESVRLGEGIPSVGKNRWTGNDMPDFKFMSLSRVPEAGKEYDSMNLSFMEYKELKARNWKIVRNTERWTNCALKVCEPEYSRQPNFEVGFYGKRKEIDEAKKQIKEFLDAFHASLLAYQHCGW